MKIALYMQLHTTIEAIKTCRISTSFKRKELACTLGRSERKRVLVSECLCVEMEGALVHDTHMQGSIDSSKYLLHGPVCMHRMQTRIRCRPELPTYWLLHAWF